MKFKDVRSIQSLLNEYGLKPGSATPVGSQQSGTSAKANAVSSPTIQKQTPKKDLGSPTTTPGLNVKEPEEQPTQVAKKVKDLEQGAFFKNEKNEVAGEIVSKLGDKPQPDKVVVKDIRGEYKVVDPDDQVMVDVDVEEGKLSKLSKSSGSSLKLAKVNKLKNKLKRLSRKFRLREQGEELIFEINFNSKEIAQQALDLPIKCGFEAETSWDNIRGGGDYDDDSDWLYDYNWYDIEDFIRDQEGSNSVSKLEESYNEWILDKAMEDYESDIVARLVSDREEDEYYINDYIDQEISEDDIEEYKERILDDLPEEDQEEYEDWDIMNWGRQYVEEELLDEFKQWLEEQIRDEGEAMDQAISDAQDDFDMDRWADYEYGSWASCLAEHDIYLSNPDGGEGGGLDEVASMLEDWASNNSTSNDVRPGDYHSGMSVNNTYWRVESDSSIQTDGTGAEIISPVYDTPRKMMEEMKSLFEWLEDQDVDTNSSTGIHVTMSYAGTQGAGPGFKGFTNDLEVNPVKLAVLLGDKYLLSTFGRENNSYAKSQFKNLEKLGNKLKSNPDAKTIEQIENILSSGISRDKFSSINFKSQTDGKTGNQLIEFRIGGGDDYHRDFNKVAKAVIRYATTMQAAYSNKLYNADYAKALYRLIANVGKISADAEERVKDRINPDVEAPAVDVLKDYFSKDNYVEHMRNLAAAYNTLAEYQQLKNQQNEDVGPDADRLQDYLTNAQKYFAGAVAQAGYDYNQGHNRATPNAKSIGILRSALKDFELDYDKLSELVNNHRDRIDTGDRRSNLTPKIILGRIKNGVDKLFKKSVVQEPEYLSANQVEKLTQGMWNAIQSDEIKDSQEAIKFANLLAGASGRSPDSAAAWVDEIRSQSANREYKEFHAKVQRGSFGEGALFTAGEPVDSKKLKALTDYLKQYTEWNHPVAKGHNPNATGDDSYIDNALSKMMIKMRSRWEHLEDIRQDNPGLYIDSMREIALLVARLVDANKTKDHMMGDKHEDLLGTAHSHQRDGHQYFGMLDSTAEKLMDVVKGIEQPNTRMVWDDPVAYQLRDSIQNYIRSAYSRYYEMKSREGDGFYRLGPVPEIIKQRTDAIKEFLTGFDKIAQKLGFDSQSSEIANKKQLDQKQADFKKKHGPTNLAKVDGFDFGGNIFITKRMADSLSNLEDRDLARALKFTRSVNISDYGDMLVIPNAHYFTALDAEKVLENPRYKNTWREPLAKALLAKFKSLYGYEFKELHNYFVDINDNNIKQKLKRRNIEFTDKLGDGRVGVGQFSPLLPAKELKSPHGEPFSPSAAVAWKVNNPELAKKAEVDDTNATGAQSHLRGLNDFGKARIKFREFDYMMNNGINEYVKETEKQDLVSFLNDESQSDTATKKAMLKLMIDNVDQQLKEPMGISQAFVRATSGTSQRENMNTFDKFDSLPLAEQLYLIAKVDKKKIDEAWSKKYKDSINCSNPKGFSQKAHCDGKKKKVSERPLTKDEKSDKEKYVKGMKKNKGDFEKRYGKDAKAVMYATATKMAKEGVAEGFKESLPDNDRITTLNKLLADVFPVSDLKKQMLAFQAIPVPQMLNDFRRLRSEAGDDACARSIVRAYINALPKEQQARLNLNESALSEAPMDILDRYDAQQQKYFELKYRVQQACQNPRTANACNKISAEFPAIENELKRLRQEIASYTARETDVDAAMKLGGEQRELDIRRAKASLKKQVIALVKKAEGIADNEFEAKNFNKVQNSIADKLNGIISGIEEDEKISLVALGKLLDHAMKGELIDTKAMVSAKQGKIDDHVNRNLDPEVVKIFDEYFKGDIFEFIPGGTTSGNYGPAEVGLAIFGNPAKKAEAHGDLEIDGVMYELKGSGFKRLKSGKLGSSIYGARLNSKGISSGTNGWAPLEKGIKKIAPTIKELNPSKDPSEAAKEPGFMRYISSAGKQASRYNLNAKGIQFLNDEVLGPYSDKEKTTELLLGVIKGIMPGWKRVPEFEKIVGEMSNDDGTLSLQRLWSYYTGLAYESYNIEDGVENILFINSNTRSYFIINNRDEMIKAIAQGKVEVTGGISWNDDQMKASPQYAIR